MGENTQERQAAKGHDSDPKLAIQLTRLAPCNFAENRIPFHASADPDNDGADEYEQDRQSLGHKLRALGTVGVRQYDQKQEAERYTGSEALYLAHGIAHIPAKLQGHKVGAVLQIFLIALVLRGGSRRQLIFFVERFTPCRHKIVSVNFSGDSGADLLMLLQIGDIRLSVVRGTTQRDLPEISELLQGFFRCRGADAPLVPHGGRTRVCAGPRSHGFLGLSRGQDDPSAMKRVEHLPVYGFG